MDKETADTVRGMIRRVTLSKLKDDGETQTASIEVAEGIVRDDIEVMQPYGFASSPVEEGALAVAVAVGGDQGDILLLPIGNPSKRMGKLNPKDVGLYNADGDKIVLGAGGAMVVTSGGSITYKVGGATVVQTKDRIEATIGGAKLTQTGDGFVFEIGGFSLTLTGGGLVTDGGDIKFNGGSVRNDSVPIDKTHRHPESIGTITDPPA